MAFCTWGLLFGEGRGRSPKSLCWIRRQGAGCKGEIPFLPSGLEKRRNALWCCGASQPGLCVAGTETDYTLNTNPSLPPAPAPGTHHCTFCLWIRLLWGPPISGLFHLASCPQGSSMLKLVSEFPSFLRLNNIPLHGPHFVCPFIHQWTSRLFLSFGDCE